MNTRMMSKTAVAEIAMLAVVVVAAAVSAIRPHSFAVIEGGDAGAAFLGSQGDVWDAQKDILCDTLGTLCASTLFLVGAKREEQDR